MQADGGPGAVVVTYHSEADVGACVASLLAGGVSKVVVVDNASPDDSVRVAAQAGAEVIALDRNVGFGAGVNRGMAALDTDVVVVANPDSVAQPGAVAALVAALDARPDLALVGPRIDNPDGTLYPNVRRFPDLPTAVGHGILGLVWPANPFTRRYTMADWDHTTAADVDWVAGTFFVVRREVFESLGGFDPRFFMYLEDVDLCWRLHRAGHGVGYEPAARVTHLIGRSTERKPYRMIIEHHRSMYRFARLTVTGWHRALLPVLRLVLGARIAAGWLHRFLRRRPHAAP